MNVVASRTLTRPVAIFFAAVSRALLMTGTLVLTFLASSIAMAAGTDTGSSALSSLQAWMMEWIPIGAALLIIACALGWIAHLVRADFAVRCVVGLIVVGSASYLVGLFGIA